jgi:DNA-binding NtrC family response regulator
MLPTGARWVALVDPVSDLTWLGSWVDRLRRRVDGVDELVACCPQLSGPDRRVLLDCGASRVVTPTDFQAAAVTDRVYAELILAGEVQPSALGALRGATPRMRELYRRIRILAPLPEPVLILGETGTGKELVARELHHLGHRKGELLAVNVGEFARDLVESELFGHQRGAFTGALQRRGLLVEAGEGTVFLDEIGDLTMASQVKLLRVLDEMKVRPVGANTWQPIKARIVLATNRDLETATAAGEFRQDLYERLRMFTLDTPPLRERRADIPALAEHFLSEPATYADCQDGPINALHVLDSLRAAPPSTSAQSLAFDPMAEPWRTVHDRLRVMYFRSLISSAGGRKDLAQERSGLSKSQFYDILKQLGLSEGVNSGQSGDSSTGGRR